MSPLVTFNSTYILSLSPFHWNRFKNTFDIHLSLQKHFYLTIASETIAM